MIKIRISYQTEQEKEIILQSIIHKVRLHKPIKQYSRGERKEVVIKGELR